MINDDVLRKWIMNHPTSEDYQTRLDRFNRDLLRIKLGFKGIGNRHISLIELSQLKRGNRIIFDYYIDLNSRNPGSRSMSVSPKAFQIVALKSMGDEHNKGILLGIGDGKDMDGDPNHQLIVGKTYLLDNLENYPVVIRMDSLGRYKTEDKRIIYG